MISRQGSILVVDDEPSVRRVVRRYLERSGFSVLDAASGKEALEIFHRERRSVACVVTDVVMAGISGYELAKRLRSLQPSLPVLFMTGYSEHYGDASGGEVCLPKPLDFERLVHEVKVRTERDDTVA